MVKIYFINRESQKNGFLGIFGSFSNISDSNFFSRLIFSESSFEDESIGTRIFDDRELFIPLNDFLSF